MTPCQWQVERGDRISVPEGAHKTAVRCPVLHCFNDPLVGHDSRLERSGAAVPGASIDAVGGTGRLHLRHAPDCSVDRHQGLR
eukprot:2385656-Rhodomonas_salina.1